jgi:hypothetical protein
MGYEGAFTTAEEDLVRLRTIRGDDISAQAYLLHGSHRTKSAFCDHHEGRTFHAMQTFVKSLFPEIVGLP